VDLFLSPEILIGLVDPVSAGRIEDVEVDSVFEGFGFVRHVRRDAERLAGVDHDFLAVDPEFERSFENVGELLVVVVVFRDDAAFFEQHASEHDALADYELALQEGLEVFERNGVPRDVLQRGFGGNAFGAGFFYRTRRGFQFRFEFCFNHVDCLLGFFLSPLRGLVCYPSASHGLRRGLYSFAASRLCGSGVQWTRPPYKLTAVSCR